MFYGQTIGMNRFIESICHCDEGCVLYGDCCVDAAGYFATKTEFSGFIDADSWQCLPLQKNAHLGDEMVCFYFH